MNNMHETVYWCKWCLWFHPCTAQLSENVSVRLIVNLATKNFLKLAWKIRLDILFHVFYRWMSQLAYVDICTQSSVGKFHIYAVLHCCYCTTCTMSFVHLGIWHCGNTTYFVSYTCSRRELITSNYVVEIPFWWLSNWIAPCKLSFFFRNNNMILQNEYILHLWCATFIYLEQSV